MSEKKEKDMSHLYTALGAVVFFVAGVPVLDAMGTWAANLFGLQSVKLQAEANKYTQAVNQEEECCHTQAVGFAIPDEQECEEDYE